MASNKNFFDYLDEFRAQRDFMSSHRSNRSSSGLESTFRIKTKNGVWYGKHNKGTEGVSYYNAEGPIVEFLYDGWRRYIEARRNADEGGRITVNVLGISNQAKISRKFATDEQFKQIATMEEIIVSDSLLPLRADPKSTSLSFMFKEVAVENSADYIDNFFAQIAAIPGMQGLPEEIIEDIKQVIACNCLYEFEDRLFENKEGFDRAVESLRPCSLMGASSPFFIASLLCLEKRRFDYAKKLLSMMPKNHWQFDEATHLKDAMHEQEKVEMARMYEQMIADLYDKIKTLETEKANTSGANQTADNSHTSKTAEAVVFSNLDNDATSLSETPPFAKPVVFSNRAYYQSPNSESNKPTKATVTYLNQRERELPTPSQ